MALKTGPRRVLPYGLLYTSAFLWLRVLFSKESFLQSATTGGYFVEMAGRNNMDPENISLKPGSRAEFCLWFVVHFNFFVARSFVFKSEFFLQSATTGGYFVEMAGQKERWI